MDKERLAGRKALITGGAQGMGAAIAKYWAAVGLLFIPLGNAVRTSISPSWQEV